MSLEVLYCTHSFHKGLRQLSASHAPTVSIPLLSLRHIGSYFSLAVNEGALSIRKDAFVWIWRTLCNLSLCWVIVPYRILGLGRQMAVYPRRIGYGCGTWKLNEELLKQFGS